MRKAGNHPLNVQRQSFLSKNASLVKWNVCLEAWMSDGCLRCSCLRRFSAIQGLKEKKWTCSYCKEVPVLIATYLAAINET